MWLEGNIVASFAQNHLVSNHSCTTPPRVSQIALGSRLSFFVSNFLFFVECTNEKSFRRLYFRGVKPLSKSLSCERGDDWFSTKSTCATSQSLENTRVRRNSEGTLNILEAREASTLQSALWDAFMRERRRLVFDGIYLRHLAAARKYARSLWSAKKLRRHS